MGMKKSAKSIRSKLSIKTYKKPRIFVILMMLGINILILIVAAIIALIIDDNYTSFIDAFTNGSVKWLLTPNAVLTIENPQTLFLAVIVLVVGLVLFSGTIIALTTNAIKDYFHKKESGSGKVYLEDHIVVLNWNSKVPELVADLLFVESKEVTLMILADIEKAFAEKQIFNALKKTKKSVHDLSRINVLVKNGDPLLRSDLEDISIIHAEAILIMNKDAHHLIKDGMSQSDLNVIKIVLGLGQLKLPKQPTIVAEVKHIETKTKILMMKNVVAGLKSSRIIPICFDRRLGQIIAQTIIEKYMEDVYLSLFSFDGSEIYLLEDTSFEHCLTMHTHAIPLAEVSNNLFVLSDNNQTKYLTKQNEHGPLTLKAKPITEKSVQEVYIIGKNNKLDFILEAFNSYEALHQSKFQAEWVETARVKHLIEKLNQKTEPVTILLLSDESVEPDALDANVIDTLIYIESNIKRKDAHIIVELLDPKNDRLIKDFNIENTIISNKIISLLLSKLALFPETASFYEDLLTISPSEPGKDDYAVLIKPANACFDETFPITFKNYKQAVYSSYLAFKKKSILFGIIRNETLLIFENNLHLENSFKLEENDLCILMKL
jgi:hypothetical protein